MVLSFCSVRETRSMVGTIHRWTNIISRDPVSVEEVYPGVQWGNDLNYDNQEFNNMSERIKSFNFDALDPNTEFVIAAFLNRGNNTPETGSPRYLKVNLDPSLVQTGANSPYWRLELSSDLENATKFIMIPRDPNGNFPKYDMMAVKEDPDKVLCVIKKDWNLRVSERSDVENDQYTYLLDYQAAYSQSGDLAVWEADHPWGQNIFVIKRDGGNHPLTYQDSGTDDWENTQYHSFRATTEAGSYFGIIRNVQPKNQYFHEEAVVKSNGIFPNGTTISIYQHQINDVTVPLFPQASDNTIAKQVAGGFELASGESITWNSLKLIGGNGTHDTELGMPGEYIIRISNWINNRVIELGPSIDDLNQTQDGHQLATGYSCENLSNVCLSETNVYLTKGSSAVPLKLKTTGTQSTPLYPSLEAESNTSNWFKIDGEVFDWIMVIPNTSQIQEIRLQSSFKVVSKMRSSRGWFQGWCLGDATPECTLTGTMRINVADLVNRNEETSWWC